jgi:NAD(P)-dependent dehydrogenase (short-subunit alcohol dehydrogenase family)
MISVVRDQSMEDGVSFANKNVVVTGASRGIGRAVAEQFASSGARVVVHYNRKRDAADAVLKSLPGGPHLLMSADLSEPDTVEKFVTDVVESIGRIDILVNNAGIYELHPISTTSYQSWQHQWNRTLGINLMGPANMMYCTVKHMKEQGGGRIVNISSRGAYRGEPDAPAYGSSKAGLNALSQSLAKALGSHNIFVYTVAPGFVETDMTEQILAGPEGDSIRNESPLGRVAKPGEVARVVLFLSAEGSEYLTGCVVDVNGASYLRT